MSLCGLETHTGQRIQHHHGRCIMDLLVHRLESHSCGPDRDKLGLSPGRSETNVSSLYCNSSTPVIVSSFPASFQFLSFFPSLTFSTMTNELQREIPFQSSDSVFTSSSSRGSGRRPIATSGTGCEQPHPYTRDSGAYSATLHRRLVERMLGIPEALHTEYKPGVNYSHAFNNWLGGVSYATWTEKRTHYSLDGSTYQWRVDQTMLISTTGVDAARPVIKASVIDSSLNVARNRLAYKIFYELRKNTEHFPRCQADTEERPITKESTQGSVDQTSDVAENTIITKDTTQETSIDTDTDSTQTLASTEKISSFPSLTDRWMPVTNFQVLTSQTQGTVLATLVLPKDLYKTAKCAPNIAPFEAYMYGAFEISIKVVMNANKFQQGKILASYRNDTYAANGVAAGLQACLSRPHVILDLPARNEGELNIPWKYHAPFMRVVKSSEISTASQAGESSVLTLIVLSQLSVASGGPTSAYGQVFYKVTRADFAGMSYRISFQGLEEVRTQGVGEEIDDFVQTLIPTRTLTTVARGLEAIVAQSGPSSNQDKPNQPMGTIVTPRPRLMFPNVKGVDDATCLRNSPNGMTNYSHVKRYRGDPSTPKKLARIWGLRSRATWSSSDTQGTRVFTLELDPTSRGTKYVAAPTPLEYATSMFAFWRGTLEIRFDFVSTAFHQGSVMVSIEYGRPVVETSDLCSTASTYTKTFHLGEQKSVDMVIPYIFDTVYRRSNGALLRPSVTYNNEQTSEAQLKQGFSLGEKVKTVVRLTVVNQLKPVQSVSSDIEVLLYWRAGPDFQLMGVKQSDITDFLGTDTNNEDINLPLDFSAAPTATAVDAVRVQMDTGEKENADTTAVFSVGPSVNNIQTSDANMDFKDILRRPMVLIREVTATQTFTKTSNKLNVGFFIPVRPPSRSLVSAKTGSTNGFFCIGGILASPSTQIVNLFRFWRGSTKYTIHVTPGSGCTHVMATYMPHGGCEILGNRQYPSELTDLTSGLNVPYLSGYASEIIVPSVNPTANLIVPYETENNWTLSWEDTPKGNYTWRDKGNQNAGHLVIQPVGGNATVTVWWAAGDDYELACFWGVADTYNQSVGFRLYEDGSVPSTTTSTSALVSAPLDSVAGSKTTSTTRRPATTATTSTTTTTTTSTTTPRAEPEVVQAEQPRLRHALHRYVPTGYHPDRWSTAIRSDIDRTISHYYDQGLTDAQIIVEVERRLRGSWPRAQSDTEESGFRLADAVTKVAGIASSAPKMLRNIVVGSLPVVGTPLVVSMTGADVAKTVSDVGTSVKHTSEKVGEASDRLSLLADKAGMCTDSITRLIYSTIDTVKPLLEGLVNGVTMLYDLMLDLFIAWFDKSWTAIGVGIVRLMGKLTFAGCVINVIEYGSRLGNAIREWMTASDAARTQADVNTAWKVIVGIIAGIVGTIVGVSIDPRPFEGFWSRLAFRLTTHSGVMYFNSVITFVKHVFQTIQEMVMWVLGKTSPEAEALKVLSGTSVEMRQFVHDAQDMTSEANRAMLAVPAYRAKMWYVVLQAMQIQRLMTLVPNNVVSPIVSRLCSDVIKVGNEKFLDMSCCPVRYEPFVICIEGPTNIGKSYVADALVEKLLAAVNYSAPFSGATYVRQPGQQFWSGYRDQPVVLYDEWMQSNYPEAENTQLTELFQLKTTSDFIPNMAHLEEKKIRANPLIVVLLCNSAFPHINNMNCPSAVYRRRDVVIRAEKRRAYSTMPVRELPRDVTDSFDHLKFAFYEDSTDSGSLITNSYNYESFVAQLSDEFKEYHTAETINVRGRMERHFRMNKHIPASLLDISDPFKIYYSVQGADQTLGVYEQDMWIASQRLERDARAIYETVVARESELRLEVRPRSPFASDQSSVSSIEAQNPFSAVKMAISQSAGLFAYLLYFISKGLRGAGQAAELLQPMPTMMGYCNVCFTRKEFSYLCITEANRVAGSRAPAHITCDECKRSMRDQRCPTCRCDGWQEVYATEQITWAQKILAIVGRGLISASDLTLLFSKGAFTIMNVQKTFHLLETILFLAMFGVEGIPHMLPVTIARVGIYTLDYCLRGHILGDQGPSEPFTDEAPVHGYLSRFQMEPEEAEMVRARRIAVLEGGNQQQQPVVEDPPPVVVPLAEDNPEPQVLPGAFRPPTPPPLPSNDVRVALDQNGRPITIPPVALLPPDRFEEEYSPVGSSDESLISDPIDFYDAIEEAYINAPRFIPRRGRQRRQPHAQPPAPVRALQVVEGDPMTLIVHNLEERGVRNRGPSYPCVHERLCNAADTATYHQGEWNFTDEFVRTACVDGLCREACYWDGDQGAARQRDFYHAYLNRSQPDLLRYVHQYREARDEITKQIASARIPPVIQPAWIFADLNPDLEIATLTTGTWWEKLCSVYDRYKNILRIVSGVVAACGIIVAGYAAYSWLITPEVIEDAVEVTTGVSSLVTLEEQGNPLYGANPRHVTRPEVRRGVPPPNPVGPQAEIDDVVGRYITKNMVVIEQRRDGEVKVVMGGIGLCGHKVLIPGHYAKQLRKTQYDVYVGPVTHYERRQKIEIDPKDIVIATNNDVAIWTWPASTNAFKDIRKFFITEADLATQHLARDATLYIPPTRYNMHPYMVGVTISNVKQSIPVLDSDNSPIFVRDVLAYNFSRPGACGGLLVSQRRTNPILGMHVAGQGVDTDGTGYSLILTRDFLDTVTIDPTPEPPEFDLLPVEEISTHLPIESQVNYEGRLQQSKTPNVPHKSKLERSSIYGDAYLSVPIEPAILSSRDARYQYADPPTVAGAAAHGQLTRDFSTRQLEGPTIFLRDMLRNMEPNIIDPHKLTVSEAICGFKDSDYYRPMDLKTSVGYPLMLKGKQKDAYIVLRRDEDEYPIEAILDESVAQIHAKAVETRKGRQRYPTLWVDTLKDEKRKIEKLQKYGGTRIICNGPLEHSVSMRQNFLHFSAAFMKNRKHLYHAVGINPTSLEWHMLATRLLNKSTNVSTLDYSNFGPGLNARVCQIVTDLIVEWTEQFVAGVDRNEMDMLMAELVNSYHIVSSTVYSQNSGSPSGNALTTVINSLVNMFYILTAWEALVGGTVLSKGKLVWEEFKRCVCLVVYGDDLIMTVKDYEDIFNTKTITEWFQNYDITATDASKTKDVVKYTSLNDAEFLKRKFVWHPHRQVYMSQLREETIKATTQWVWSSANRDEATRVNCEVALMNAHGHGPEKYEEIRARINAALARRKIDPLTITWRELDEMIYDKGVVMIAW
nr:MAG: polyprotein [Iflaviridae sp.]